MWSKSRARRRRIIPSCSSRWRTCWPASSSLMRRQPVLRAAGSRIPGWEAAGLLLLGTNRFSLEDYPAAADALQQRARNWTPKHRGTPGGLGLSQASGTEPADSWAVPRRPTAGSNRVTQSEQTPAPIPRRTGLPADPPCSKVSSTEPGRSSRSPATYRAENPLVPEPSPYVGSAKCAPCHQGDQQGARIRPAMPRSFHHGAELLSLPRPAGPSADPDDPDVDHTLSCRREKKLQGADEDR